MLQEIRKGYIGNPAQLITVRRLRLQEGRGKGTEVIEVATAGGLSLDILPDAGLDIGQARFKGVNVAWMCKNGYDAPASISSHDNEFPYTFPGGLVYTCGLRSTGGGNMDQGEYHPTHGRYHGIPADNISIIRGDETVTVSGVIRETALFGSALEVVRTITIPAYGSSVTIHDQITNQSPRDEEYMQIYHCNFGYPLLSEQAQLYLSEDRQTIPRTPWAETGLAKSLTFDEPIDGEEERVFFHLMKEDFSATLKNPALGMQMTISWSGDTLPILAQWRSMASGDYVLGLEPTNCYIMGRHDERENGTLPVLKAWESIVNTVTIEFKEEH